MVSLFGTDGIRGRANQGYMRPDHILKIAMAAGRHIRNGTHRHSVIIGKDTRLSGYMIENAMVAGFTAVGVDVYLLGPLPTPAVAMLTRSLRADLGVMISASHNQYEDNGIKFFNARGNKLAKTDETAIEALIEDNEGSALVSASDFGRARRIDGGRDRYCEFVKQTAPKGLNFHGLHVAVDCANGAAYKVAPEVLWEMGAKVTTIGDRPDGVNINRNCGSLDLAQLREKVCKVGAHLGLAFDGDADRLICLDEKGEEIDGDQLIAVIAQSWQQEKRLKGEGIVVTPMSNGALASHLSSANIKVEVTDSIGDRHVAEKMRAGNYNVGGEQSGHIILSDYNTTGDGLLVAIQLIAAMRQQNLPASKFLRRFSPNPQLSDKITYVSRSPLNNDALSAEIKLEDARLRKRGGRVLTRESGTEANTIRLMCECPDAQLLKKTHNFLADKIRKAAGAQAV